MRHIPTRFSLRSILVFVALVAVALTVGLEWRRLKSAQDRYANSVAAWMAAYVPTSGLVSEVDLLYQAESETLWISHAGATRRHVVRLSELADRVEARVAVTTYGSDGSQHELKVSEQLRAMAAALESADRAR